MRDWVASNITLRRGMPGAKPDAFVFWMCEVFNLWPEDEMVDLFYGSGAVTLAVEAWRRQTRLALVSGEDLDQVDLFAADKEKR